MGNAGIEGEIKNTGSKTQRRDSGKEKMGRASFNPGVCVNEPFHSMPEYLLSTTTVALVCLFSSSGALGLCVLSTFETTRFPCTLI